MLEDKLSAAQRIRLEAIAQACNAAQFKGEPSTLPTLMDNAASIAAFVTGAPDTVTPLREDGVTIPEAMLGNKLMIGEGLIRCNEVGHCNGQILRINNLTTFDDVLSTLIEHFE